MKLTDVGPKMCRVCLTRTPKLRSLYEPLDEGEQSPNEMLALIAGITLEEAENYETLPKCICKNCELSLSLAHQFRIKVLHTHQIIEAYRQKDLSVHKIEEKSNQTLDAPVKIEFEDVVDESAVVENIYLNEEILSNKEMKVEMLEMSFSDVDDINMENEEQENLEINEDECKPEYLDEFYIESNLVASMSGTELQPLEVSPEDKSGKELPVVENTSATTSKSNEECDNKVSSDVVKDKNFHTRGPYKKRIISKENKKYICDVCGNIYAKRGRMTEHRRRHDKELRYACELCDKRFHLREHLRKHMYQHKGGKPFKCSFCSRTFFYESVKKAHEAIHSGVKPYVCDVCNKAFAYQHALGKHKLIHADVKFYHCDYCDKDFRLQHHLKQHKETKSHQSAVRAYHMGDEEYQEEISEEQIYEDAGYVEEIFIYQQEGFKDQNVIDAAPTSLNQLVEQIMN
ncbi:zinc finger protein 468-like [Bactrocera tryoni]|uniref:zinc finger protein 468-like n=1 Tax=Bactrocera tryoni TaxID=59916 RepID=UPI001A956DA6|nr:zinc finger protein 468-like [Bactrocera tryoni]